MIKRFSFLNISMLIIALAMIPFALAEITMSEFNEEYHYGESIEANASVSYKIDFNGLFSVSIKCADNDIEFYKIPLSLDEGKKAKIIMTPVKITKKLTGSEDNCRIYSTLSDEEGDEVDDYRSDNFDIIIEFNATVSIEKDYYNPEDILVADIKLDVPDEAFESAKLDIILDDKLSSYELDQKESTIEYIISDDAKSGKRTIIFQFEDDYGNYDEIEKTIEIASKPTYIKNRYLNPRYYANQINETLRFKPLLYDQAMTLIDDLSVKVTLLSPDNKIIDSDKVISTMPYKYIFGNNTKPGTYKVVSTYKGIEKESSFEVLNSDYDPQLDSNNDEISQNNDENQSTDIAKNTSDNASSTTTKKNQDNAIWKYMFFILAIIFLAYLFYTLGRKTNPTKQKGHGSKHNMKSDEFYNLKKK